VQHGRTRVRGRPRSQERAVRGRGPGFLPDNDPLSGGASLHGHRRRGRGPAGVGPRHRVFDATRAVRPPDSQVPSDAPQDRRHGHRGRGRQAVGLQHGSIAHRTGTLPGGGRHVQVVRVRDGDARDKPSASDIRRLRIHDGISHTAAVARLAHRAHRRRGGTSEIQREIIGRLLLQ